MQKVLCSVCPHACVLLEGQSGLCRARACVEGKIVSLNYGKACAVAIDPIEKKPLYHVFPASGAFSIGLAGCNLRCKHCQNSGISQKSAPELPFNTLNPQDIVPLMDRHNLKVISYTYTEPLVSPEYVLDCAKKVSEAAYINSLVTAAYINPESLRPLLPYIHAANVDIKSMSEAFYARQCGVKLAPVLEAVKMMNDAGIIVEITNLLIPTMNDSVELLQELAEWICAELGKDTPLHFSRFFPHYQCTDLPPTPIATLHAAKRIAKRAGLHHVYLGNIGHKENTTFCPQCDFALIERPSFGVVHNHLKAGGLCPRCETALYGLF